jgi:hypothetical protein
METKVVEVIQGEEGMLVIVTLGAKGLHVSLRDSEADEYIGTKVYPFDKFTSEQVHAAALALAGK